MAAEMGFQTASVAPAQGSTLKLNGGRWMMRLMREFDKKCAEAERLKARVAELEDRIQDELPTLCALNDRYLDTLKEIIEYHRDTHCTNAHKMYKAGVADVARIALKAVKGE